MCQILQGWFRALGVCEMRGLEGVGCCVESEVNSLTPDHRDRLSAAFLAEVTGKLPDGRSIVEKARACQGQAVQFGPALAG